MPIQIRVEYIHCGQRPHVYVVAERRLLSSHDLRERDSCKPLYDGLTPEARALADEFREFVLAKDDKIRARRRNDEERRYDALCYQYERQMLAELIDGAGFGELVSFENAMAARAAFEHYLQEQAARKRDESSVGTHVAVDERIIEGIMAAYDRIHGESLPGAMGVMWDSISSRVDVEYCSAIEATGGDAKA